MTIVPIKSALLIALLIALEKEVVIKYWELVTVIKDGVVKIVVLLIFHVYLILLVIDLVSVTVLKENVYVDKDTKV